MEQVLHYGHTLTTANYGERSSRLTHPSLGSGEENLREDKKGFLQMGNLKIRG